LELAMGCHFRVADSRALFGLPEVKLGLLPGAGGTVRLPRLVGPEKALPAIVSGNPMGAKAALSDGLVDAVYDADLVANAVAFARDAAASGKPLVAVRDRDEKLAAARADLAGFDARIAEVLKKSKGL